MKQIKITAFDLNKITASVWDDVSRPKGVILLVPDLKEHAKFYEPFATYAEKQGYVCVVGHLRLHSTKQNPEEEIQSDYFKDNVNDFYALAKLCTETFSVPLTLVGVGFGAYLTIRLTELCDFAKKVVLIGAGYAQTTWAASAKPLGYLLQIFSKRHHFSKQIEQIMFYPLKRQGENYFTTDTAVFERLSKEFTYTQLLPSSYYYSTLTNILGNDKNLKNIAPKTKFLLLSGTLDPIANNGKSPQKLQNTLNRAGLKSDLLLFDDAKHSLLLEKDPDLIFDTLLDFLAK